MAQIDKTIAFMKRKKDLADKGGVKIACQKVIDQLEELKVYKYMFKNTEDLYIASSNWYGNFIEFYSWLEREREDSIPTGPCGQSMTTVNGVTGLVNYHP